MTHINHKAKGMALLEVLVAMVIFALAILPLVRLQIFSMDATKAGYYKTETAAAAESLMDYLKTDTKSIYDHKWDKVIAIAGANCRSSAASGVDPKSLTVACNILNGKSKITADGNAILCVFGKRPQVVLGNGKNYNRDQYLISIRAVWYIGKRESGSKFLNRPLQASDCGTGYDDHWDTGSTIPSALLKENIEHIKINMAY